MPGRIVIAGTLDTKGDQFEYLKQVIEKQGLQTILIDVGIVGKPTIEPDINHDHVARAAGFTIEELINLRDQCTAMEKMAAGVSKVVKDLYIGGEMEGIAIMGGSMGTALALEVMNAIPLGVPKVVVSTVAHSPCITADMVNGSDIVMLPWIAGLWGLNPLSERCIEQAAGIIAGAVEGYGRKEAIRKKMVGITGQGVSYFLDQLRPVLLERNYEVAVFHALGMSGRIYERAIMEGLIDISIEFGVGLELLNYVVDSAFSPGANRLEAAGKMGIPQIVAPTSMEFILWGAERPLPSEYKKRIKDRPIPLWHNRMVAVIDSSDEECIAAGKLMAQKLNKAKGSRAVVYPMGGHGDGTAKGTFKNAEESPQTKELEDKRADFMKTRTRESSEAFYKGLMDNIGPEVHVVEVAGSTFDPIFIDTIVILFDKMAPQ